MFGKKKLKFPTSKDVKRQERKEEREEWKRIQKEAAKDAYRAARLKRIRADATKRGSTLPRDYVTGFFLGPPTTTRRRSSGGGKKKSKGKKKTAAKKSSNPFNIDIPKFDPFDNWGFDL